MLSMLFELRSLSKGRGFNTSNHIPVHKDVKWVPINSLFHWKTLLDVASGWHIAIYLPTIRALPLIAMDPRSRRFDRLRKWI